MIFPSYLVVLLLVSCAGNFPMISDDLVNSYHLLLCAFDLVLTNALMCNARKDLLNPDFKGLPEDFNNKDYRPSAGHFCFIQQLCELHDGLVLEAKGVKEHFWKPFIRKLFHKRVGPTSFHSRLMVFLLFYLRNRLYEEHVLATGSLDERIFTGEGANENIGTPGPCLCEGMENQDSTTYRLSTNIPVGLTSHLFCFLFSSLAKMINTPSLLTPGLGSEGLHSSDGEEVHPGGQTVISALIRHEELGTSSHSAVRDQTWAEC
ncbi:hypothetical protein GOODEAATRI_009805 [Goodea atripinnis]|uniref:Uncharacterized protein n=1 Tax=Goodea atripinnis TaxID=208336 RepID=A0ABV0NMB8_9TELE